MKERTSKSHRETKQKMKLTLKLGEWNGVKVHVTLQEWSFQVHSTSYLWRRKHTRIIGRLQHKTVLHLS